MTREGDETEVRDESEILDSNSQSDGERLSGWVGRGIERPLPNRCWLE